MGWLANNLESKSAAIGATIGAGLSLATSSSLDDVIGAYQPFIWLWGSSLGGLIGATVNWYRAPAPIGGAPAPAAGVIGDIAAAAVYLSVVTGGFFGCYKINQANADPETPVTTPEAPAAGGAPTPPPSADAEIETPPNPTPTPTPGRGGPEEYNLPADRFDETTRGMEYSKHVIFWTDPQHRHGIRYEFENLDVARRFYDMVGQAFLNGGPDKRSEYVMLKYFQTIDLPDAEHPGGDHIITGEDLNQAVVNPEFVIPQSGRIEGLLLDNQSSVPPRSPRHGQAPNRGDPRSPRHEVLPPEPDWIPASSSREYARTNTNTGRNSGHRR